MIILWIFSGAFASMRPIKMGRIFLMKTFVVNARRAAFGWPFYNIWNLVAYAKEQEGPSAKAKVALCALPLVIFTTALWAAPWFPILWMILQATS
jgi:hypothetical protein